MAKSAEQKAAEAAAKEVKQAEKAAVEQVKAAQAAEITLLKSQGVSKDIINAEKKANSTELAQAKTTLAAPGQQSLLTGNQNTFISAASAYSGATADNVAAAIARANQMYTDLGITNASKSGDTKIGLGLDKLVDYNLGQAGSSATKTIERAQQFVGKSFTPEEIAAQDIKIKEVKGAPGLYQYKTGESGNNVYTFFRKDENGNYVGTGVNRTATPKDDGGFFSSGLGQALMIGGSIALALTPGGQAFAAQIGSALSGGTLAANSLAAQALGQAAIRGVSTGVITGDIEKGLIAAAVSGAGSALNLSGELGNFMDSVNLGDYKDALGVIGGQTSEAAMAAADAVGQAAQGLSASQIATNLAASGISSGVAQSAAQLAVQGATTAGITSAINNAATNVSTGAFDISGAQGTGLLDTAGGVTPGNIVADSVANVTPISGGPVTPTNITPGTFDTYGAADLGTTGTFDTFGAQSSGLLSADQASLINQLQQSGLTMPTGTFDTLGAEGTGLLDTTAPVTNLDFPYNPNYVEPSMLSSAKNLGEAVVGSLMSGMGVAAVASQLGLSTSQVQQIANTLGLGGGSGGGAGGGQGGTNPFSFGNLINQGINYERAAQIAGDLQEQARFLQAEARKVGQEAQVPFTPFTLTTGTGTSNITAGGATSTLSPALQALQQQQIGLAGQTFGAINPGQATQQFYGNLEALAGPTRQREQEALLSNLGARGLLGIGRNLPTTGGGVAGVNPYMESLLSAQERGRTEQALMAQQFGTSEAIRQQQLGQGFQTGALNLDTQALNQLARAQGLSTDQLNLALRNAEARRVAGMEGLRLSAPLYGKAGDIKAGQTNLIAQQTQGLFDYIFK
jgi:hypothetical protein